MRKEHDASEELTNAVHQIGTDVARGVMKLRGWSRLPDGRYREGTRVYDADGRLLVDTYTGMRTIEECERLADEIVGVWRLVHLVQDTIHKDGSPLLVGMDNDPLKPLAALRALADELDPDNGRL